MTGQEAIDYIEDIGWSGSRSGLSRTIDLLKKMGDPHKKLKFIHVAGSNGKGSVCSMLDAILRSAGYRTGLYTSPYIQDFCERIQINGKNVPRGTLGRVTECVKILADAMEDHPTQFEMITAIAFEIFFEANVDIVILETGLGGALDATNVIPSPILACITNIGLEHTDVLGNTLEKISREKAGIIKPGCHCICYDGNPIVNNVIRKTCAAKGVPFNKTDFSYLTLSSESLKGQEIRWKGKHYSLSLLGRHQLNNAAVALTAIEALQALGWNISNEAIETGLKKVKWPARLEVLSESPLFILDGGHNPQCAVALAESLNTLLPNQKMVFLCGILSDKNYPEMIKNMLPYAIRFVCLTPHSERALNAEALASTIRQLGGNAEACEDYETGICLALAQAKEAQTGVVAFGSLYMAGEVRTIIKERMNL